MSNNVAELNFNLIELRREYVAKGGRDCEQLLAKYRAIGEHIKALGGAIAPVRRGLSSTY